MSSDDRLIAEGNVEAFHEGRRLRAERIIYDSGADRLILTGPITVVDAGGTVVVADAAELDRNLHDGILRGARIVMEEQLQLAASVMGRSEGRYSQLFKAAVTSCRVCGSDRPPLWQIRAERVVHDQKTRQLYFYKAQFRVLDTPVFYLPRLRMPDPTVKRATGFLSPSLINSSLLGFGAKVPFFLRLGDDKDLTLTPVIATDSRKLELRYRQKFRNGDLTFSGAVADDEFDSSGTRGYLFGSGRFDLPRDFVLRFDLKLVSDDTFLLDHDYSDEDRLESQIEIARVRRDEFIRGAVTHFRSVRVNEPSATQPRLAGDAEFERRLFPSRLGGELRLAAAAHSHFRSSDLTVDGPDFDQFADGRDVTRLTFSADWMRRQVLPAGVFLEYEAGLAVDGFRIGDEGTTSKSSEAEVTPRLATTLRWPLMKAGGASGATHVVEPVAQLAWAGGSDPSVPNDESERIEFDEGNLFSPSRFTGPDRRERDLSGAYGISWTRIDPTGWQSALAVGQVLREDRLEEPDTNIPSVSKTSGLRGLKSDLLIAGQLRTDTGLTMTARGLIDDDLDTSKAEARASWQNDRTDLGATYVWLPDDAAEIRRKEVSEWAVNGSYRFARHWTGSAQWRYDAASDETVRAGVGLAYTNECVEIALTAARRFTSSTELDKSTNINLTVALRGFQAGTRDKSFNRSCDN